MIDIWLVHFRARDIAWSKERRSLVVRHREIKGRARHTKATTPQFANLNLKLRSTLKVSHFRNSDYGDRQVQDEEVTQNCGQLPERFSNHRPRGKRPAPLCEHEKFRILVQCRWSQPLISVFTYKNLRN
jgi:hypothetical protein